MRRAVLVLVAAVAGYATAAAQSDLGTKRTAEVGGVMVVVTALNLLDEASPTLDFELAMDTHSGSLPLDMAKVAGLAMAKGPAVPAKAWTGAKGGHHLSGKLSFPRDPLQGWVSLTLTLKGVGGGKDISFRFIRDEGGG